MARAPGCRSIQHRTTALFDAEHPALRTHILSPQIHTSSTLTMSSIAARSALRAAPRLRAAPVSRRWASAAAEGERAAGKEALKTGAKRDPELYVCRSENCRGSKSRANWFFRCSSAL